jgi:hypothetical protein
MKNFSLKFIDILIGIVLGLGFQWWPLFTEPWQYVAFIFAYFDIVDYWIDYAPSLKKFPPKREFDVMLDLGIMFILFLYIYATIVSMTYFLVAFIVWRVLDYLWLWSSKHEYSPGGSDKLFVDTWMKFNLLEAVIAGGLVLGSNVFNIEPMTILAVFIICRIIVRVLASLRYKKVHFA